MFKINYYLIKYRLALITGLIIFGITLLMIVSWQFAQTRSVNAERPLVAEAASSSKPLPIETTARPTNQQQMSASKIAIDVKGGVHRPGVYYFNDEPIVETVVTKAGGLLPTVDQRRINLAAKVGAGNVLYIPVGAEKIPDEFPLPTTDQSQRSGGMSGTASDSAEREGAVLNLNQATATQLMELPGIGEKRAQDIIDQRDSMGGFKTIDDLKQVSGIGEKTFAKLAPLVAV